MFPPMSDSDGLNGWRHVADRLGFDHGKHQELLAENTMFTGRHLVIPKLTDEK